jgi:hypothetical protein
MPTDAENASKESLLASSIGEEEWQKWLVEIPALRSILIYDTCESGSALKDQTIFWGDQRSDPSVGSQRKLATKMRRTSAV